MSIATATVRSDGRARRATGDAIGKVRIVVQLVGVKHRLIKGNMTRVITLPRGRVSRVARYIEDRLIAPAWKDASVTSDPV